jgi:Spy/CpxP family protein refolding chaperone
MRHKTLLAGLTTVLFFLAFSAAFAQNPPEKTKPRGAWFFAGERGERLADFLNLTPEQKTKFEEIRKARQEDRQASREEMSKLRPQLREGIKDPKADPKKIDELIDQMSRLRAAHLKSAIHGLKDMQKVLTPEQLEKFRNARSRMAWRRGFGRGFGFRHWMRPGGGRWPFMGFGRGFDRWL